jgi:hypothetical protein
MTMLLLLPTRSALRFRRLLADAANAQNILQGFPISILDDKVSSLMAKVMHHEECNSFVLGIIESACEMLRCKIPFDLSFFPFCPTAVL